jgi:ubiquinone/menaquinone biosynthesis C-methylase UbiE
MAGVNFWDQQAKLADLRAVIDLNDQAGHKNAYIDCLTKTALAMHGAFDRCDHVIDFGCGIGRISLWLRPKVASVRGVDASAAMIEQARLAAERAGIRDIEFSVLDAQSPVADAAFDKLVCVYVLECIADDAAFTSALREMARVTRPGARLLFIERTSDEHPDEPWMPDKQIRRRPLEEYRLRLSHAGLVVELAQPVRTPARICNNRAINRLVLRGLVPSRLLSSIARFDLARLRRDNAAQEWADYIFVCRKRLEPY